ncbi:hypothetical protein [Tellurirhabdus bombi]|uniref:hypothetical protein n=1 Tax=Tellurirhabdus bombi TaxID=2907205 RepID=UPI001F451143|nr:hypothetical protein [Tellurirhabdus bombi]
MKRQLSHLIKSSAVLMGLFLAGCYKYEERVWPQQIPEPGSGNPPAPIVTAPPKPSYIENGAIRVGVDLNMGGSITFLGLTGSGVNLINNYDTGRQIQASFYSGPVPYKPNGKEPHPYWYGLGWNPVQSGDYLGNRSKVLAFENDGRQMYIKTQPMIWPVIGEVADCHVETWITLENNTVKVRCKLTNFRSDTKQYPSTPQELPAVYTNGPYHIVTFYNGWKPFTNDTLSTLQSPGTTTNFISRENWVAMVNEQKWGLGVWKPDHYSFVTSSAGAAGRGGEYDVSTTSLAPFYYEILDHNIQYDYNYTLIVGSLSEIRQYAYAQPRPSKAPNYRFVADRQHWQYYGFATDAGWPINNELNVSLAQGNFLTSGPFVFWQASDIPKIYVRAAYNTEATHARLRWRITDDPEFLPDRILDFPIISDGQFHTYELDMTKVPSWRSTIVGLGFEPALGEKGGAGKFVKIQSITASQ